MKACEVCFAGFQQSKLRFSLRQLKGHLRTEADLTSRNNLANLPPY